MPSRNAPQVLPGIEDFETWFLFLATPRPGIAKPEGWQHMDLGRLRPPVADRDPDQDVLRASLGVFDEDVKVAVLVEDAGVEQFVLGASLVSRSVGIDDCLVRVRGLRILIEV